MARRVPCRWWRPAFKSPAKGQGDGSASPNGRVIKGQHLQLEQQPLAMATSTPIFATSTETKATDKRAAAAAITTTPITSTTYRAAATTAPPPPPPTICHLLAIKLRKTAKTIITFIAAYCGDSNMHGLQYVVKGGLTTIEKIIWLLLLVFSITYCIMIGLQSLDRYQTKSTVVGLDLDFYAWNTTLPSATVCPLERLNRQLFEEYSGLHKLSSNESQELFHFLEMMANATYSNFRNIPSSKSLNILLYRLRITPNVYMSLIYNLTGDMSLRLKKDLQNAMKMVHSTAGDLHIQTRQILTEYGLCYMTNSLLPDSITSGYLITGKIPLNTVRGDPRMVQIKQSNYFDGDVSYNFQGFGTAPIDGFIHSYTDIMEVDHNLGYALFSFQLEVEALEIVAEENLENRATISQRKCRFHHESNLIHYPVYTKNLCLQECRLNLVYQICKCIPHFYPNRISKPKPVCDYRILKGCFVQNENFFVKMYRIKEDGHKEIHPCYCQQNCQDAIVNLRSKNTIQRSNDLIGGNSIFFTMVNPPKYRLKRQQIFSFTDLMVSFGGTAGFFLGLSVLSLIEILYYLSLRLFFFIIDYFNAEGQRIQNNI